MKIYNCVICGVECTGIPDDQMLYHLELCGSDTCFDKYMSRPTPAGSDSPVSEKKYTGLVETHQCKCVLVEKIGEHHS